MPGALQVVIVCDKMNEETMKAAKTLVSSLPAEGRKCDCPVAPVKILDGREPPVICDLCIHFEVPQPVWFSWARANAMFVKNSSWLQDKWGAYWDFFDIAVFDKDIAGAAPRHTLLENNETHLQELLKEAKLAIENREPVPKHMPPILHPADCPPISIVTLVHNRPQFIQNACLNLLSTDYPKDKIEWVVVDDSDPTQSPSNIVIQFAEKFSPGEISYIPLLKKHSIGEKRNLAIEKAKHNIIVMMDDDDHYPSTSFRRRVAYLLKGRKRYECATCTTIAMYDLLKGISAVNVPPYTLSLSERCSEASMVFTKDFWKARKFEDTSKAEGEAFLKGRENKVVEMPPQQMIVALSHGTNLSGRKMPDASPGCFWGFPRQLLEFLHGLVGVKVEAAS